MCMKNHGRYEPENAEDKGSYWDLRTDRTGEVTGGIDEGGPTDAP